MALGLGQDEAEDRLHQRRFARPVRSDDGDYLPRRKLDRYSPEDVDLAGIAGDEVDDLER
jgi:hypothetical protein